MIALAESGVWLTDAVGYAVLIFSIVITLAWAWYLFR